MENTAVNILKIGQHLSVMKESIVAQFFDSLCNNSCSTSFIQTHTLHTFFHFFF